MRVCQASPAPARHLQAGRHSGLWRRVGEDLADRPLHVRAEAGAEVGVVREAGIIGCLHEAGDETSSEIFAGSLAGMDAEHRRVAAEVFRIAWRAPEHLRPVVGEPLDVLGVAGVGKG
jgi:hypothetical protein